MNKLKHILIILLVFHGVTICAQKVSNIAFRQEQSNIIVSYDLETKTPCKITLFVSTNDGNTWTGPLKKITSDIGAKITTGSHSITWNVLEEFEELRGDKIQFQVRAEGENIQTVKIGNQEWMTKNLAVSTYRNGDIIPEVKDPKEWDSLTTGAWCYYNNDPTNGAIYGKLYNWYAVNDPRGLAPEGFHVPSDTELNRVTNLIEPTGFAGLTGGTRDFYSTFSYVGSIGYFWSSSEYDATNAWRRYMCGVNGNGLMNYYYKKLGISVRCLRD